MSRFIRRFRHFMRRIFSRNRNTRRRPDHDSDLVQIQDKHDSDSVQLQDQQDSDCVQIQDQQESDPVQIQDQQESDCVLIQDQQDSGPVQIQDQQESDCVLIQDQQDSDSVQIQDQHDSDCVLIQDQQDSDPAQIQDQQESDPVQIQDQQESDCTNTRSSQESDSVQIQDQQDSDPVQIQDQGRSNFAPIDQPSNFDDVTHIFSSHLAALHADPGRLDAVRESWTFKLCLHCTAYRISVCGHDIYYITSYLKHNAELARLGFYTPEDEDFITLVEKDISDLQEEKAELTWLLDQARHLGLGQDVDNVTRAAQLNLEVRRLMSISYDEGDSGRWDQILRYIAECVNLLSERHEAWPSWPDLDQTRQKIMKPEKLYGYEDRDREAEWLVLLQLLSVSYRLLPPHAEEVRKYANFQCRYLDQEAGLMGRFIAERSVKRIIQAAGKLMTGDDKQFCELSIELLDDFGPPLPTHWKFCELSIELLDDFRPTLPAHRFGLRLYRLCLRLEERDLADTVMRLRFTDNPDKQQLTELLNRLLTKLPHHPNQSENRIILHTEHSEDVTGRYVLPELISEVETLPDEPPLVKTLIQRSKNVPSVQGNRTTGSSARCAATTESLSGERESENLRNRETKMTFDPLKENQEVAQLLTSKNSIPDGDILFSYIDISPPENSVILRFKDCNDVNTERETSIAVGVPYHCRVLTYHPVQNDWSVTSDMCRISRPLDVEQEGATCVPFVGDCGEIMIPDAFVYKIHKSRSDHALREYMADVRTQSTAAWYVTRFRELTKDRFGILTMLHSDLVIVYQDSHRDTILELTTRELHSRPVGSAVKFDKYMNNALWKNKNVNTDLLECFSHFTHHASERTLMVTDLQGWVGWDEARDNIVYILTDPVIHCPWVANLFGRNNRRSWGIDMFYKKIHPTCNHICKSLNLVRP